MWTKYLWPMYCRLVPVLAVLWLTGVKVSPWWTRFFPKSVYMIFGIMWHWWRFIRELQFWPASTFLSLVRAHLHLNNNLIRRKSRQRLETFQHNNILSDIGEYCAKHKKCTWMSFRGEFAKCQKLLLAASCLSVFPHGATRFALDRLS